MYLEIRSKGGRVVKCFRREKICKSCKKGENAEKPWYYYNWGVDKGLYCRDCAVNQEVFLEPNDKSIFFMVDKFEFINEEHIIKGENNGRTNI